jgi:hypothetical protein
MHSMGRLDEIASAATSSHIGRASQLFVARQTRAIRCDRRPRRLTAARRCGPPHGPGSWRGDWFWQAITGDIGNQHGNFQRARFMRSLHIPRCFCQRQDYGRTAGLRAGDAGAARLPSRHRD